VKKEAAEGNRTFSREFFSSLQFGLLIVVANCEIIYVRTSWEKFLNGLPRSQKTFTK